MAATAAPVSSSTTLATAPQTTVEPANNASNVVAAATPAPSASSTTAATATEQVAQPINRPSPARPRVGRTPEYPDEYTEDETQVVDYTNDYEPIGDHEPEPSSYHTEDYTDTESYPPGEEHSGNDDSYTTYDETSPEDGYDEIVNEYDVEEEDGYG